MTVPHDPTDDAEIEAQILGRIEVSLNYEDDDTGEKFQAHVDAFGELAEFYSTRKRWSEAEDALHAQRFILEKEDSQTSALPDIVFDLVVVAIERQRREEAMTLLREAQRLARDNAYALGKAKWERRYVELKARLAAWVVAAPAKAEERWAHPKFGNGVCEGRSGDILQIRFSDGVVRKIALRFLARI